MRHKEQISSKSSVERHHTHPILQLDSLNDKKPHDFTISHKSLLTNGHHHSDFFSLSPPVYPLPPAPLGPGSPGMIASPMISPTHCTPIHLHPPPLSSTSHTSPFHQAPITAPNSFPLPLPPPQHTPQQAIASCSTDPSSPMQVVCSPPSHQLMRIGPNGGSSIFQQNGSTHFPDNGQLSGMIVNHSTISLQPATFIPPSPVHLQYSSASASVREYSQLLTGVHHSVAVGSEYPSYHLPALPQNDSTSQQYH